MPDLHVEVKLVHLQNESTSVPLIFCFDPNQTTARRPDGAVVEVLRAAACGFGLPEVRPADLDNLATPIGWEVRVDRRANTLAIDWAGPPGLPPMVYDVNFNPPQGWLETALEDGTVVLFCGHLGGLTADTNWYPMLAASAAEGTLIGGALPFRVV